MSIEPHPMNRSAVILSVSILLMASCQKPSTPVVDKDAAAKAVAALFDSYSKANRERDFVTLDSTFADDGLFLGTDPEEFWDKAKILDMIKAMARDSVTFDVSMDKREIRISEDGMSAVVIEQSQIPLLSEEILVRGVGHARMIRGKWRIDFYSWSLIPQNEDLAKLNKAMRK